MSTKDTKELLRKLDKRKIKYTLTKSGHYRVKAPDGKWVTISGTAGGGRSVQNAKAHFHKHFGIRL